MVKETDYYDGEIRQAKVTGPYKSPVYGGTKDEPFRPYEPGGIPIEWPNGETGYAERRSDKDDFKIGEIVDVKFESYYFDEYDSDGWFEIVGKHSA